MFLLSIMGTYAVKNFFYCQYSTAFLDEYSAFIANYSTKKNIFIKLFIYWNCVKKIYYLSN